MDRKKLLFYCFSIIFILCLLSFSDNPPDGRTGAPDELSCMAIGCHGNSTQFNGNIEFLGFPAALVSGQTFDIGLKINVTSGSPVRGGFQLVGLGEVNGNLVNVGEFSSPGNNVRISNFNSRNYFEHQPAQFFNGAGSITYNARWTTPNSFQSESVTIYAAAVLANGNSESSGDKVIFGTLVMPVTNVTDADGDGFNSDLDCDDTDPLVNPDATEIVNNNVDEDCDGTAQIIDEDMDGFNSDVDCDDLDSDIKPNGLEIPNNDVDENCDGIILVIDEDMDGFNSDDDCNDMDANINPGATEIANNDVDENCDGIIEVVDFDQDGFHEDEDCNDQDSNINPGATDIPDNGIDEDCSGSDATVAVTMSGRVLNFRNDPIANVIITDSSSGTVLDSTDQNGDFTIVSPDNTSVLSFSKEARPAEGLSTGDLVIITNHILNRIPFTNPLQLKIADVNESGSVSSSDLVIIKQIILQRLPEFNNRTAWNFEPSSIETTQSTNNIVIRAFKLGDVNSSASRQ